MFHLFIILLSLHTGPECCLGLELNSGLARSGLDIISGQNNINTPALVSSEAGHQPVVRSLSRTILPARQVLRPQKSKAGTKSEVDSIAANHYDPFIYQLPHKLGRDHRTVKQSLSKAYSVYLPQTQTTFQTLHRPWSFRKMKSLFENLNYISYYEDKQVLQKPMSGAASHIEDGEDRKNADEDNFTPSFSDDFGKGKVENSWKVVNDPGKSWTSLDLAKPIWEEEDWSVVDYPLHVDHPQDVGDQGWGESGRDLYGHWDLELGLSQTLTQW